MVHTNLSGWRRQWVSEWPRTSLSDSGLYGLALWRIAVKARPGMEAGLSRDKYWEDKADATTGLVTIYKWETENTLTCSRSSGYLTSHVSAPAAERLFWQWLITFQVWLIKTSARNRTNRRCFQPAACDAEGGGANGWKQPADVMEGQHELSSQVTCCVRACVRASFKSSNLTSFLFLLQRTLLRSLQQRQHPWCCHWRGCWQQQQKSKMRVTEWLIEHYCKYCWMCTLNSHRIILHMTSGF